MQKRLNIDELPAADLDTLATSQADWDGLADGETAQEDDEILEEVLEVDVEDGEDVLDEDDDNPYQESDEALPDDDEERAFAKQLREE